MSKGSLFLKNINIEQNKSIEEELYDKEEIIYCKIFPFDDKNFDKKG